jgi:hypothetical protein
MQFCAGSDPILQGHTLAAGTNFKFVDGVNRPKGRALRIALNPDAVPAGRVRGIEHQLAGHLYRKVLVGHRLAARELTARYGSMKSST